MACNSGSLAETCLVSLIFKAAGAAGNANMRMYSSSSWDWFEATIFVSLDKVSAILFLEDT